ncbi:hypothetical protein HGO34_13200 [Agrobacterium vitis]|uniref:Rap1a immunity protein domain-containing protein n=1 Tax=Agrobacterium vitis TaxID=373 RepID=A0AAE4WGX3_AGRVI|nr:hypothetical protein [Agrobacterium vitis]MCF1499604.1 hypothetical protein [Allorhizobium sp. Av2]MCM2440672.1 hypothetical protein [Agrobacterium vitis]MUZ59658.1 hypothetical protein [Agrobacterium vitis]MVA66580.1 hypothetical protein [Agrobacterium vitis]MVA87441.1 hypothetical protein [Agrobacterium vitis]
MRLFFFVVLTALTGTPASALTSAELLQSDQNYARGYLWGALNSYLLLVSPEANGDNEKARASRLKCLQNAKINDRIFHQAVIGYINLNPRALTEDAVGPMIRTLIEICER